MECKRAGKQIVIELAATANKSLSISHKFSHVQCSHTIWSPHVNSSASHIIYPITSFLQNLHPNKSINNFYPTPCYIFKRILRKRKKGEEKETKKQMGRGEEIAKEEERSVNENKQKEIKSTNPTEKNNGTNKEKGQEGHELPLMALNHVSRLCRSVKDSIDFYTKVLGFVLIERPQAFDFDGAWLFNYGVGIHLVQSKDEDRLPNFDDHLDPMDNHISFQCEDMEAMEQKLKELDIEYMKRTVGEEEGAAIDQLFFKDPDGFMIEICNCENLKLVPADSVRRIKLPFDRHNPPVELH